MNNILIIGNGGRECAIAYSLVKSVAELNLYYFGSHSNPGLDRVCKLFCKYDKSMTLQAALSKYIKEYSISMVIIGPEAFLAEGVADFVETLVLDDDDKTPVKCIGPLAKFAQLETSKFFTRNKMKNFWGMNIYNPRFEYFSNWNREGLNPKQKKRADNALDRKLLFTMETFMDQYGGFVIKENGLCGGKGVKVSGDHFTLINEGFDICKTLLRENKDFIIEEKLVGQEFSLMSFCDGNTLKSMPVVRDFKRAYEDDLGPNTGGMGSISYDNHLLDFLDEKDIELANDINTYVIRNLQKDLGDSVERYVGILYGSFMKLNNGQIKVIEYNCRFGDPECINALSLLKTNLFDIFQHMITGTLDSISIEWEKSFTICKYLVPEGYPQKPVRYVELRFDDDIDLASNNIIFASVCNMQIMGSRSIAIIGKGKTMKEAYDFIENIIPKIHGPLFYRKDIGLESSCLDNLIEDTVEEWLEPFSYKQSGVDIDKGNEVVERIQQYIQATQKYSGGDGDGDGDGDRGCCFDNYGDFGGMYRLGNKDGNVLVSSTDGVGTKSILALEVLGNQGLYGLGMDLVNHCVNDILVKGAYPLFFLDYFASSKLDIEQVELFVKGLSEACVASQCVLIGGETAEMPGVYHEGKVDLVGTIVGQVNEACIIDGKRDICAGNLVIGLRSDGPHTNGFSFIRTLYDQGKIDKEFATQLLTPHRCYLSDMRKIHENGINIFALCHITGGGLIENPKRVLPLGRHIRWKDFEVGDMFKKLQQLSGADDKEMRRVFNCGIGMLIFIRKEEKDKLFSLYADYPGYLSVLVKWFNI